MEVMFILIGFSLLIALIFLGLFFWAVHDGQYDDQHTPSIRMLFDNKLPEKEEENNTSTTNNND